MKDLVIRTKEILASRPGISAAELIKSLGVSQPTISRALKSLGSEVIRVGRGRTTKYACSRTIRNLDSRIPIFLIDENNTSIHAAELIGVQPNGFFVQSQIDEIRSDFYPDLPYWIDDLRPSGFLGRLIPKRHPELRYPEDVRYWSADDSLHYLATLAWDTIGNLIVGEDSYGRFCSAELHGLFIEKEHREIEYPKLADDTIRLGVAGSSAGGEQPKFLAISMPSRDPVLVKFSPKGEDALSTRRKDLLQMEHLASVSLQQAGISSAETTFLRSDDRAFLEIKRFDRINTSGRRGLISLQALDNQFAGKGGNWRELSRFLLREGRIDQDCYEEILTRHYFGLCIGNSDMHPGNLSFYSRGEVILGLAPVYDMLPMTYAPTNEQLRPLSFTPPVLLPNDRVHWLRSVEIAIVFWEAVRKEPALTQFSGISENWISHLTSLRA